MSIIPGGAMKKYVLFFVIWSAVACYCNLFAQYPDWINYTDGQSVHALADNGNELWIGTGGGLVKLDKTTDSITFYNHANSGLPSNWVRALAIDGSNIWVGTCGGLAKFDGTNWTVYKTSNSGLPCNNVLTLAIDDNSNIWIGAWGGGLAVYTGAQGIEEDENFQFPISNFQNKRFYLCYSFSFGNYSFIC